MLVFLVMVFLVTGCDQSKKVEDKNDTVVKEITISGLKDELVKYKEGKTKFDIEFEAMTADQFPFIKKLKAFAASNGYKTLKTASKKKPLYETDEFAPVIRILTNSSLDETIVIAEKIQINIFGNSKATIYDVVP